MAFLVLLALALTVARLLLPGLGHYRAEVEAQVSALVKQPVSIGQLEVSWHGWGPRLILKDVGLLDAGRQRTIIRLQSASVDLSVPATLFSGHITLSDLTLMGIDLALVRREDGSLMLEGIDFETDDPQLRRQTLEWLWSQPSLGFAASTLRWRDRMAGGREVIFRDVAVRLTAEAGHHRFVGRLKPPLSMGDTVQVALDIDGEVMEPAKWKVVFFADSKQLQLPQWLREMKLPQLHVEQGVGAVRIWGVWQGGAVANLRAEVDLHDVMLRRTQEDAAANALWLPLLSGRLAWSGDARQWRLDADRLRIDMGGTPWPAARVHVGYTHDEMTTTLTLAGDYARLDDVARLAIFSGQLRPEWQEALNALEPGGEVRDALVRLRLSPQAPPDVRVRAKLQNVAFRPSHRLPGASGVDGDLDMDARGGTLTLATRHAVLDTAGFLREPVSLDILTGSVVWHRQQQGWRVQAREIAVANADLAGRMQGELWLPQGKASPLARIEAQLDRGAAASAARYWPVRLMPDALVAWLDRAIVSGKVTAGTLALEGPIDRFPFDDGSGRFDARVHVEEGVLAYADGWPRASGISADAWFHGNSLQVDASTGTILQSNIGPVRAEIADLRSHAPRVKLIGITDGWNRDLLYTLAETPLQEIFGDIVKDVTTAGRNRLALVLDLPVHAMAETQVRGVVHFFDGQMEWRQAGIDVHNLTGAIGFSNDGLIASGVTATVLGQPAQISMRIDGSGQQHATVIEAAGQSDLGALAQRFPGPYWKYVEGQTGWNATLRVPVGAARVVKLDAMRLAVESSLQGVAVRLPSPFGKAATGRRMLGVTARLGSERMLWNVEYDPLLSAVLVAERRKNGMALTSGEIHLGAGSAQLPTAEGVRIAGALAHLDEKDWREFVPAGTGGQAGAASLINAVTLKVGELVVYGQRLHDVDIDASRDAGVWRGNVASEELSGKVSYPLDSNRPVVADMDYIRLVAPSRSITPAPVVDPRELPPMQFDVRQFSYGDANYGEVHLVADRHPAGLTLRELRTQSPQLTLRGSGSWLFDGGTPVSALNLTADVRDLGGVLVGLGYVSAVEGGQGEAQTSLRWRGGLLQPDMASMEGNLSFNFKKGRLLEVEPGAGRVFGLLSVQALPRRLLLDFSDIFGKGYGFDRMRGRFDIKAGQANTKDFMLEGPIARINISGRVGLATHDFDQRVIVVPEVTSSLPLAGAVTAGVGVGAVIWLAEKMLKPTIVGATQIEYSVKGSWEKPLVERVER